MTGEHERSRLLLDELAAALSRVRVVRLRRGAARRVPRRGGARRAPPSSESGLERVAFDNPWVEACRHIAAGRLDEAGDALHAHEAYAYAAMVRLLAAERAGGETPGLPRRDCLLRARRRDRVPRARRASPRGKRLTRRSLEPSPGVGSGPNPVLQPQVVAVAELAQQRVARRADGRARSLDRPGRRARDDRDPGTVAAGRT